MKKNLRNIFALCVLLSCLTTAHAQTPNTPPTSNPNQTNLAPSPQTAASQASQAKPSKKQALPPAAKQNEFTFPKNATPDELLQWAIALTNSQRQFSTEDEYMNWLEQMFQTVLSAADQVLTKNPSDETYFRAIYIKGRILYDQSNLHPEQASTFEQFVQEIQKDPRVTAHPKGPMIVATFRGFVLQNQLISIVQNQGTQDQIHAKMQEILNLVLETPSMSGLISDCIYPVTVYAETQKNPALVNEIFGEIFAALNQSQDATHQQTAKQLEGLVRFAQLPGHPMELEGTLADETAFDPKVLEGKIVLVDFWATWCMPCLAVRRDLMALYLKYQDQGFEIVGYSIDNDIDEWKSFETMQKAPWISLSQALSVKKGQKPLGEYYGIMSIPTLILIGRDGNVLVNELKPDDLEATLDALFAKEKEEKEDALLEKVEPQESGQAPSAK